MTLVALVPLIPPLILAYVFWYVWRHRTASGARSLLVLMAAVIEWGVADALRVMPGVDLSIKIACNSLRYIGIAMVPVAWLTFALEYTGRQKWLSRRNVVGLLIVPLITSVIAVTNIGDLMHGPVTVVEIGPFVAVDTSFGPWFWIHAAYSYVLILTGTLLILQVYRRSSNIYRKQAGALLLGAIVPWISNALVLLNANPIRPLDLTSMAFTMTAIIWVWALFRYQLFDIAPVARDVIFENMTDVVIVVDAGHRVVDLNPAAQREMGYSAAEAIGQPIQSLLANWPDVSQHYQTLAEVQAEVARPARDGAGQRFYDLRITSITDRQQRPTGRLIVLRDVTDVRQMYALSVSEKQLRASADVGRAAVSILDTDQLLSEIVNLITDRFGFYYTAVFLADSTNQWAVLREATSEAGHALKERKHQLEIGGQSMVGTAMKTRKARIALDVGEEAVRFANPLLPDTRSEIALPLVVGTRVIGALDVQSTQAAAFDEASAVVLQSMADQIAIALSNTLQFQQAQVALQRTQHLYEASTAIANAADAGGVLQTLMTQAVTDASTAQILTYGPSDETGQYAYFEVAAHWTKDAAETKWPIGMRVPPEQVLPLLPAPGEPHIIRDATDATVLPEQQHVMQALSMRALLSHALVAGSQPVGLLLIAYRDPHLFTSAETQPLQALAGQIAVTLRNQQLVREQVLARQQLDEINQRLTGQIWQQYAHERGEAIRKIDIGPGMPPTSPPAASELAAPVLIHGQEVGRLYLEDATSDREWTPNEKALIQAVAGEVAIAIENARLIEQTERRAQREARLNRIAQQLRQSTDIHTILQTAAEQLSLALDTSHAQAQLSRPVVGEKVQQ